MIKTPHSDYALRKLAFILLGYFIGINVFLFYVTDMRLLPAKAWPIFTLIAAIFLLKPKLMLPISILYTALLNALHWLNSRILLGFIFYLIFTPIGLARRLLKKDTLHLSYRSHDSTYRTPVSEQDINDIRRPY